VVQLYVRDVKSSVDRPAKELKGFRRVMLNPGEAQDVSFTLDKSALSFYSVEKDDWVAEPGAFEVWIGASSRDIRLKGTFELTP
jgi:beta-glucosidase